MAPKSKTRSSSSHDKDDPTSLLARVEHLQSELSVLQRLVGKRSVAAAELPANDFRVLCADIADDRYGIRVDYVREIVHYVHLTRISDVPSSVVGAINVRGQVLAVVDARRRFGLKPAAPTLSTSIVLLGLEAAPVGLIVDRVVEVSVVPRAAVQEAMGPLARSRCLAGVTTIGDALVQLLDLNRILDLGEWQRVSAAISELRESTRPVAVAGAEDGSGATRPIESGEP